MTDQTRYPLLAGLFIAAIFWSGHMPPQLQAADPGPADEPMVRELYVPFDQLPVILGAENERVFITRQEYRELQKLARQQPPRKAPVSTLLLDAQYEATVHENVVAFKGQLEIDVLEPGWQSVTLPMAGVQIRRATLDQAAAPLARNDRGQVVLFVSGIGRHTLDLELHAPIVVAAAQQSITFELPHAGSVAVAFTVPGNVEVKSGADVIRRRYDDQSDHTNFDLAVQRGTTSLVMSLNNRRLLQDQVIVARSVIVSELTTTSERLHANVSLHVLHGACDTFSFHLPEGFQVTHVSSPLLAQWVIRRDDAQQILEVRLREATRVTEVVNIAATGPAASLDNWSLPQFHPLEVTGHVAVIGLLADSRLQPLQLTPQRLLPIDVSVLRNALPESLFATDPGAPQVRPIAAFYAPADGYSLTGQLQDPQDELRVTTHLLLSLGDSQQSVTGGFTLVPNAMKRKTFSFRLPASWQLDNVHLSDGSPLDCSQYRVEEERRCVVTLPQAIEPGKSATIYFQATYRSSTWLEPWDSTEVTFPKIQAEQASTSTGAIAVQAKGDLRVQPSRTEGLTPLDAGQRARFGLDESKTELTFHFTDQDYVATFAVERVQPVISSRNYSFFQISNGSLAAHYEVIFDIARAHTRELQLDLPASTPSSLTIQGLDGVKLKESSVEMTEEIHHWKVLLAEAQMGRVRLTLDFKQPLPSSEATDLRLPVIHTGNSAYQTQMVSVEGDPSLDISITTKMRAIDVGELVAADYSPGPRLLGTFASTDGSASVHVDIALRDLAPLPAAVVQQAELVTQLSPSGVIQSAATYQLRTKVPFLAVQLPPGAELWSTAVNGTPRKPRRRGDQILLSVQTDDPTRPVTLQIAYQTKGEPIGWLGNVAAEAPRLSLVAAKDDPGTPVPLADLVWRVYVPAGYRIARSSGTVTPTSELQRPWPVWTLARSAVGISGGLPAARMLAHRTMSPARAARQWADEARSNAQSAQSARQPLSEGADRAPAESATHGESGGQRSKAEKPADHIQAIPAAPGRARNEDGQDTVDRSSPQAADPFGDTKERETEGMGMGGMGSMGGMAGGMGMSRAGDDRGKMSGPGSEESSPAGQPATDQPFEPYDSDQSTRARGLAHKSKPTADKFAGKYWALQGLRGLTIQIDPNGAEHVFRSLGVDPSLRIALYQEQRMDWLAWAVAIAIGLGGLLLIHAPIAKRFSYVAIILLLTAGLPLLAGPFTELTMVCEKAMFAAALLVPAWILIAFAAWLVPLIGTLKRRVVARVTACLILIVGGCITAAPIQAQDDHPPVWLEALLQQVEPVRIPEDAVVIPYDPNNMDGRRQAEKVLVPYERYVELWKRAYEQTESDRSPDRTFSLAGARYEAELADADHLLLTGQLQIELFTDQAVEIPLALQGAMVTQASLNNQTAPLKAIEPAADSKPKQQAGAAVEPLLGLVVRGRGRHQLDLTIRVAISRQGGWRHVRAIVPHAEATALSITMPASGSQIRRFLGNGSFLQTTVHDNQTMESVLAADGRLELAWRPRISPGSVDQSLTAKSTAIIDLREDGIHATWQTAFEFGETERAMFQVSIPAGYLVESVQGDNIRGWDVKQQDDQQELTIELLQPVKGQERVTIHFARRFPMAFEVTTALRIPYVETTDAALNHGTVLLRRSPLLEVTTTNGSGVARTDSSSFSDQVRADLKSQKGPLGVRDYQAFRFHTLPFDIDVDVKRIPTAVSAELRTLVRIGETESALESQIHLDVQRGALYRLQVAIPSELQVQHVSCAELSDWSTTQEQDHQTLNLFLATGQQGSFPVSLQGKLGDHRSGQSLAIPRLEVMNVNQQHGTVVFQVDTSLNAKLTDLHQCEPILPKQATAWLTAEQRPLARLAIEYRGAEYGGQIALTPARSFVSCNSFTNIRITFREIQETILLDYHVSGAGAREFQFLLPDRLADAQIDAPLIRQRQVEPVEEQSLVRVTLSLQDAITGQYRVVIQKDRALHTEPQVAPLPQFVNGSTGHRFLTLENSGRDEVVVESVKNMEPVNRDSRQWQHLSARLRGGNFTTAYVAQPVQEETEFVYRTKRRELVKTVGATIGLSRTTLVLDESGAYRVAMLLKVDNRTEPYLEIALPQGAELWSAFVANQPVKPAQVESAGSSSQLRIPLVKTAEGDLDYAVVLKYGGRLDKPSLFSPVQFPFLRTVNINVQRSQVKLWLPKSMTWFQFSSNATRSEGEDDFLAGYVDYRTRQLEGLTQILSGKNDFSKARASGNVYALAAEMENLRRLVSPRTSNQKLNEVLTLNSRAVESANAEIQQLEDSEPKSLDNRERLHDLFLQQRNSLSRNRVTKLGRNFSDDLSTKTAEPTLGDRALDKDFDRTWFFDNGLARTAVEQDATDAEKSKPGAGPGDSIDPQPGQRRYSESSIQQQRQKQHHVPSADFAAQNVFDKKPASTSQSRDAAELAESSRKGQRRDLETQQELADAYRRQERQQQAAQSEKSLLGTRGAIAGQQPVLSGAELPADRAAGERMERNAPTAAQPVAGWSSLDVDLPERGTEYYFSRPGADVMITARPIDRQLLGRLLRFGGLLAMVAFLLFVFSLCRRISASRRQLTVAAVALCLVGGSLTVLLIVPLAGLILIMSGILVASRARQQPLH